MKIIFSTLFFFFSFSALAQINKINLSIDELKDLPGNWTGNMVYTAEKSQVTFQSKLEIVDMKDSMILKFIHTDPEGKPLAGNYIMRINKDGNKLRFDSSEYDIVDIRRRGVRLEIIIEREGVDNYRSADFQQSIIIGPATLNIVKRIRWTPTTSAA